jgi:hypothetical protein
MRRPAFPSLARLAGGGLARQRRPALALTVTAGLLLAALLLGGAPALAQLSVGHVKGLFIERFTRFIEWPPGALPANGPFEVCIQGSGDTAEALGRVAATRKFKERPTSVRRLPSTASTTSALGCHVLYLAPSESSRLTAILAAVADRPILTVSDTPRFGERGVSINLFQEGRFLRFEINTLAVRRSHLIFSSQLLRLGRLLGEPGGGPGGGP